MTSLTKVLLVEDDLGDAALTQAALSDSPIAHFEMSHVRSLDEASKALSDSSYHVILLDLNLPDSRNLETVRGLLQCDPGPPIIVLSGQDDEDLAIKAVQEGAQDYILKGDTSARTLSRAIHYAIERKRAAIELARLALYDDLTGLPTRALLRDRWRGAIARAKRTQSWVGILLIDLNEFKTINDNCGHLEGDRVLREVGERLTRGIRGNDTAARFGGDEFVVLLENIRGLCDVESVAEKIKKVLHEPMEIGSGPHSVSASVGAAISHYAVDEPMELVIQRADSEMYAQKKERKLMVARG